MKFPSATESYNRANEVREEWYTPFLTKEIKRVYQRIVDKSSLGYLHCSYIAEYSELKEQQEEWATEAYYEIDVMLRETGYDTELVFCTGYSNKIERINIYWDQKDSN